jgi:hypothetical protein
MEVAPPLKRTKVLSKDDIVTIEVGPGMVVMVKSGKWPTQIVALKVSG